MRVSNMANTIAALALMHTSLSGLNSQIPDGLSGAPSRGRRRLNLTGTTRNMFRAGFKIGERHTMDRVGWDGIKTPIMTKVGGSIARKAARAGVKNAVHMKKVYDSIGSATQPTIHRYG